MINKFQGGTVMKIYFEDGKLDNPPFCDYHVDAAEGVMANIYWLDAIKEKSTGFSYLYQFNFRL